MEHLEIVSELCSCHNFKDYLKTIILSLDMRSDSGACAITKLKKN